MVARAASRFRTTLSVRSHLLRLVLALLIPMLALAVGLSALVESRERDVAQQSVQVVAQALSKSVDTEVWRTITTLEILAQDPSLQRGHLDAIRERLEQAQRVHGRWASAVLIAADGRHLLNLRVPKGAPLPEKHAHSVSWRKAIDEKRPQVMDVFRSPTSGAPAVGVLVPVLVDGVPRYVLGATLEPTEWQAVLAHDLPPHWMAALDDRHGTTIAGGEKLGGAMGAAAPRALKEAFEREDRGVVTLEAGDMGRTYVGFHRSELTGWHTMALVPASVVEGPLQARIKWISTGAFLALLVAGIAAIVASRPLSRAIASLRGAVERLGNHERVRFTPGPVAEVNETGAAINTASKDLEDLRDALSDRAQVAEEANRLKDRFLGTLGHELRNPIAAISGANAVIAKNVYSEPAQRMVRIVERQSRHLASLVDDLLDASAVVSGRYELARDPVDLGAVLTDILGSREAAGDLGGYDVKVSAEPAIVLGDSERLTEALGNVIDNALRYTGGGGTISVMSRTQDEWATVVIRDSGLGMDAAMLHKAFEPFTQGIYQVGRTPRGLGMGLTISRHIIERHAGSIVAASAGAGKGSTLTIRLPLAPEGTELAPAKAAPLPEAAARPLRVVVIEDNADVRDAMVERLRNDGHTVVHAGSGYLGLELLKSAPFDVALIDLGLPDLLGQEVARRARAAGVKGRLVALTGYGSEAHRAEAMEAGFDAFLVKPATGTELRAMLTRERTGTRARQS